MMARLSTSSLCLAALVAASSASVALGASPDGPEWSYRGEGEELGPMDWANGYPSCAGSSQSPINFASDDESQSAAARGATTRQAPLLFEGDCFEFSLYPGEHAFKWFSEEKGECQVRVQGEGEASYSLARFQIHSPAEHTVKGHAYDAEIQFVHTLDGEAEESKLLIVSLFIEEHHTETVLIPNEWMVDVWDAMRYVNESVMIGGSYADLLLQRMQMGDVYRYEGSLTTPPCTEEVTWWVIRTPLYVSKVYLENYRDMLGELIDVSDGKNARATQPRNGREVTTFRYVVDQGSEADASEADASEADASEAASIDEDEEDEEESNEEDEEDEEDD